MKLITCCNFSLDGHMICTFVGILKERNDLCERLLGEMEEEEEEELCM